MVSNFAFSKRNLYRYTLENIFANNLLFNEDGSYAGFDPTEFTSKAGGKAEAVKHVKKTFGHGVMAMVGDGATVGLCTLNQVDP
jgi:hypothetical protein